MTAKKCTKMRAAFAKLLFFADLKLFFSFLPLSSPSPSPTWVLKLSILMTCNTLIVALTCSLHVILLRDVSPVEQVSSPILMLWLTLAVNTYM